MTGETVSQVVESHLAGSGAGEFVLPGTGWQEYALSGARGVRKIDPGWVPISTPLGVLGTHGHTADEGLLDIGKPKPGATVVFAASGAVGSVVEQLARLRGCRVVVRVADDPTR